MPSIPLLDLKPQYAAIKGEILTAVGEVFESQRFILGEAVERFEREIAAYCGVPHAIGCASGSDALILALRALGVGRGDRVLTTPYSFFATAAAIELVGAVPVFADVEDATFNLDPVCVKRSLSESGPVKAIIAVHLFGGCADMDGIEEVAGDISVIEDAAQAIGATYRSRPAGQMGAIGCFSFFPSKNLGAFGDGGLLTTCSASLDGLLRILRVHGSREKYVHETVGYNSRLDALQAAVLRVKLRYLDGWTERRQRNADLYRTLLVRNGAAVRLPEIAEYQTRHVFNQFVIRCEQRDELRAYLTGRGIGTEVYYPIPLHLQPCFSSLGYRAGDFPVSEKLARESLALPIHPDLTEVNIEHVAEAIGSFSFAR